MYSRIVAPLDGSTLALQALPYARLIAASTGATLVLVKALNTPPADLMSLAAEGSTADAVPSTPTPEHWAGLRERARADSARQLDDAAGPARRQGLNVETVLKEGDPVEAIAEEADKDEQTLIAMSTHGRSGVGRWLMGSVTDRVVREGKHATLIVRAQAGDVTSSSPRLSRVLLPVDGSPLSEAALPHAAAMAQALGCGVTAIRAVPIQTLGEAFADYVPTDQSAVFAAEVQAEAESYLARIVPEIGAAGVDSVDGKVVTSNPGNAILDEVGDSGERLVVMATHGRTGVGRWLMGSVTDRVIRHSPGPVLVIRP